MALSGEKHRKSRSLAASEAAKGQDSVFYIMDFRAKQSWTQPGSAAHSRCDHRQVALGASFLTWEEEPRGCPPPGAVSSWTGCCRLLDRVLSCLPVSSLRLQAGPLVLEMAG